MNQFYHEYHVCGLINSSNDKIGCGTGRKPLTSVSQDCFGHRQDAQVEVLGVDSLARPALR